MKAKTLIWLANSRKDARAFPKDARYRAGKQLWLVQSGLDPDDWKPLPSVGSGVREIRIHTGREHRVIYVARFAEAVYVLHAFEKKSAKTLTRDIELARNRLGNLLRRRAERQQEAEDEA